MLRGHVKFVYRESLTMLLLNCSTFDHGKFGSWIIIVITSAAIPSMFSAKFQTHRSIGKQLFRRLE